jgi:uncharacterized protein (DUF2147 family)
MPLATLLLVAISPAAASEPSPAGLWKTMDDKTGEPRGFVRIYKEKGAFFGKIEASLRPEEVNERCDRCTDERKDQPIIGLVILRGLKKQGAEFSGGDILDPETGTVYRCKLRVMDNGNTLLVRGYIGVSVLGRTQTWLRVR